MVLAAAVAAVPLSGCGAADAESFDLWYPERGKRDPAPVIYDPIPYPAGTYKETEGYKSYSFAEDEFDYNKLYVKGAKREASGIKQPLG